LMKFLMKLIPQSLLARTAIVILLALVASQLVSVSLFRHYAREPRIQLAAIGFIGQLKTIRAALEIIPPSQHREFLQKLREERGMRVFRVRDEEPMVIAPDLPALRVIRERMREEIGSEAEIYIRARPQKPDAPPVLITKLPVGGTNFYVVFPRGRVIEQDYTLAWVGWGVFGGILALAGAMFLMYRVNRPLKAMVQAAHELGHGKAAPPLPETGPTEVRSVAVAFNQMREDLQKQEADRATFLAGVSHDLRTPLSRLRLAVEMLPADPTMRRDIENDIGDINGVIDQFMDFARDESREPPDSVDLNALLTDAAARTQRANPTITINFAPTTAAIVRARPMAIKRVISNLIDNAVKHAGGTIDLSTRCFTETTTNFVEFAVQDRGSGIAPQDVERLKQPFTRLDASRAGASGAGLGLAIVDRIIRNHQGRFNLLPREGGGTDARVALPV
jgi:two-component system, OmpR family, osmolarity sensor histidine kinase EnvZ